MKALADTFDSMIGRLEQSFEQQRQFVQDASHELRTPLAAIRTNIEVTEMDPDVSVEEYRSLLRVVELATLEGDQRFRSVRTRFTTKLTEALAEAIEGFRKDGKHPADLDPQATAGVLVSMLAHVAAHRYGFEFWGIRTDDTQRSMTRIVYTTVTGQRPPAGA